MTAVELDLVVPHVRFMGVDPVKSMLGVDLADILSSLMRGPLRERVPRPHGFADVYPLSLPAGEGLNIPLGPLGEIGFRNDNGQLVLTVPPQSEQRLRQALGDDLVHSEVVRSDSGQAAVDCWVRLRPGARAAVHLPAHFGELAIEVPATRGNR